MMGKQAPDSCDSIEEKDLFLPDGHATRRATSQKYYKEVKKGIAIAIAVRRFNRGKKNCTPKE